MGGSMWNGDQQMMPQGGGRYGSQGPSQGQMMPQGGGRYGGDRSGRDMNFGGGQWGFGGMGGLGSGQYGNKMGYQGPDGAGQQEQNPYAYGGYGAPTMYGGGQSMIPGGYGQGGYGQGGYFKNADGMQGLMRAFQGQQGPQMSSGYMPQKPQMQQSYQPYNNAYDNVGG